MQAYAPGEQPEGGGWIKLNTNEFPYPPSPKVREAVLRELGADGASLRLYPNPESAGLRAAVEELFGVGRGFAMAANGSDDVLNLAVRAFCDGEKTLATMEPSYSLYPVLAKIQNTRLEKIPFNKDMSLPFEKIFGCGANMFFLVNPNAPTGVGFGEGDVRRLVEGFDGIVLIDEAYAPFAGWSAAKLAEEYDNAIITGTSSKGWGLAGMRIGWAIANPKIIEVLDRARDSYNVDRLAQAAGIAALGDREYYAEKVARVVEEREKTQEFFASLGWRYFKSSANFILFAPKNSRGEEGAAVAKNLFEFLRSRKILLRYFPNEASICDSIRLSIGAPEQMEAFKQAVKEWQAK